MLKAKGNTIGIAISQGNNDSHNSLVSILWSYGASYVGPDSKTVTVNSPEMKQAVSFIVEPGQSLAARDLTDKLLDCLKPNDRLLVNLLHVEGRSVEEVKQLTGWNISMIKVRAFRARKRMRKHMDALMKERAS